MSDDALGDAASGALEAALARVITPLVRLALARGLPYARLDEMLRAAFVAQAHAAHPGLPPHRRVSRVSAATGLNRREVSRLVQRAEARGAAADVAPPRTPAAMVFAHWRADPAYRTRAGAPRVLPRTGPAPSFESLAQAVTRDVHPRALLEELLRLKLATHDEARDTVSLVAASFVPRGDAARLVQWLGANTGDHLAAAVDNLLGRRPEHHEQAIAADGLSAESVALLRPLLARHWHALADELVPLLERLVDADAQADRPTHRVRIGLYGFDDAPAAQEDAPPARREPDAPPKPAAHKPAARKKARP